MQARGACPLLGQVRPIHRQRIWDCCKDLAAMGSVSYAAFAAHAAANARRCRIPHIDAGMPRWWSRVDALGQALKTVRAALPGGGRGTNKTKQTN